MLLAFLLATAQATDLPDLDGTWVRSDDDAALQASIDAGLDVSAGTFPLLYRSFVRNKLAEIPTVCDTYAFRDDDAELAWRCDTEKELVVETAALGTPFDLRWKGKVHPTTVTRDGSTITAVFEGDKGARTNLFVFDLEAGTLTLTATVKGDRLVEPLVWTVNYRREGGPVPAAKPAPTAETTDAADVAPTPTEAPPAP